VKKIVVVVDNAIIAMEIKKDLERDGYLVPLICRTLKEVLNAEFQMDLVIFDLDFISKEKIREVNVPVIFLSSLDESEFQSNEISTLEITYDFLYKPFTKEELLHKTTQILSPTNKNS
jgi:DNA-binding response OmpR family regulator